jgi:hypothetical protein
MMMLSMALQGQAGNAVQYITRNQALKKLQLKLPEFRQAIWRSRVLRKVAFAADTIFFTGLMYTGVFAFSRESTHVSQRRRRKAKTKHIITSRT